MFYRRRSPRDLSSAGARRVARRNNDPGYIKFHLVFSANYARNVVDKPKEENAAVEREREATLIESAAAKNTRPSISVYIAFARRASLISRETSR